MEEIKQKKDRQKRFDEHSRLQVIQEVIGCQKHGSDFDEYVSLFNSIHNDDVYEIEKFIEQEVALAVKQERERVIEMIDRMERDCVCSPLQTEICDIERTFRRTQHRIINLINNN